MARPRSRSPSAPPGPAATWVRLPAASAGAKRKRTCSAPARGAQADTQARAPSAASENGEARMVSVSDSGPKRYGPGGETGAPQAGNRYGPGGGGTGAGAPLQHGAGAAATTGVGQVGH